MFTEGIEKRVVQKFETLWEFMVWNDHPIESYDYMLCLGSLDLEVPTLASKLWHSNNAKPIVMSGGIAHFDDLAHTPWDKSEATVFAKIAIENGVDPAFVFIEDKAQNTAQNFLFSEKLFSAKTDKRSKNILAVCKPYMGRRARNTATKTLADKTFFIHVGNRSFKDYFNQSKAPNTELNLMIGDMHRILIYPELDFMVPEVVPNEVKNAFNILVESGFDKHMLRNENGLITQ